MTGISSSSCSAGSGKTELIRQLKQSGEPVIDLEDIACHKGSAFGNIGMPAQPGQEMFENLLGLELRSIFATTQKKTRSSGISFSPYAIQNLPIWIEDESQRIGLVNLPNSLWSTMRTSKIFFLDIPFEERLAHIVEEYGALDRTRMIDAIGRIKDKLGSLNARNAAQLLEEGNITECFRILLAYYDKFYSKALNNRENINSLLHRINCESISNKNVDKLLVGRETVVHSGIQTS